MLNLIIRKLIISLLLATNLSFASAADPYERYNRKIFSFNERLDSFLFKPAARFYNFITPGFIDKGITNIFSNLSEPKNVVNNALQLNYLDSSISFFRLITNSTFGFGGFFDVCSYFGFESKSEDFGQTLSLWGIEGGPYIVLPVIGGRYLRDSFSIFPDNYLSLTKRINHPSTRYSTKLIEVIDIRSDLIDAEKLISGDRYIFIRDIYFQTRLNDINANSTLNDFDSDF